MFTEPATQDILQLWFYILLVAVLRMHAWKSHKRWTFEVDINLQRNLKGNFKMLVCPRKLDTPLGKPSIFVHIGLRPSDFRIAQGEPAPDLLSQTPSFIN